MAGAPYTSVAEKGVTILEWGVASTWWRDHVDIVRLSTEHGLDEGTLVIAPTAIADHRRVPLGPISPAVADYSTVGQRKWAAWHRKEHVGETSEPDLEEQLMRVAEVLDHVFGRPPSRPTRPETELGDWLKDTLPTPRARSSRNCPGSDTPGDIGSKL